MTPELSPELRQAVHALGTASPLRLVDPDTNTSYVLVRAEVFDRLQAGVGDDELAVTYPAQFKAAMQAGWADPEMDVYNKSE
jgi:hypothetical protein